MKYPWYDIPDRDDFPDEKPRTVCFCDNCGGDIYEGEEFFVAHTPKEDFKLCEECVERLDALFD